MAFAGNVVETNPEIAIGAGKNGEGIGDVILLSLVGDGGEMPAQVDGHLFGPGPGGGAEEDIIMAIGRIAETLADRDWRPQLDFPMKFRVQASGNSVFAPASIAAAGVLGTKCQRGHVAI